MIRHHHPRIAARMRDIAAYFLCLFRRCDSRRASKRFSEETQTLYLEGDLVYTWMTTAWGEKLGH